MRGRGGGGGAKYNVSTKTVDRPTAFSLEASRRRAPTRPEQRDTVRKIRAPFYLIMVKAKTRKRTNHKKTQRQPRN